MLRNPAVKPGSKPKSARFFPKTGWVSAGMAHFSYERNGYRNLDILPKSVGG